MSPARRISAVFFDFDGVLIESASIKTKAFERLFRPICPEFVEDIVSYHEAHEGISRFEKFRHIYDVILKSPLTPQDEERLGRRFSELVLADVLRAPIVSGFEEFMAYAQERFLELFVVSGTPQDELRLIAHRRGLYEYFRDWRGSPLDKCGIIRELSASYGINPINAVFIGDARTDMEAAGRTGLTFVARVAGAKSALSGCPIKIFDLHGLPLVLDGLAAREAVS